MRDGRPGPYSPGGPESRERVEDVVGCTAELAPARQAQINLVPEVRSKQRSPLVATDEKPLSALHGSPVGHEEEAHRWMNLADTRLITRLTLQEGIDVANLWNDTRHREELIARSGVVLVISGNRARGAEGTEMSPGVLEEVAIARRAGKFIIPIGATGHAARKIWEDANAAPEQFLPGAKAKAELAVLGNSSATNEQLLNSLFKLLAKAERAVTV